jgi:hypothetical protein
MSNYQMKEGQGSLFKNDKKQSPAQPDYYGSMMVNGKEMRLAAWIKEGKTGKFFSMQLSEPREQPSSRHQENAEQSSGDLPF